jgi:transcriptional regulator with XRE-family HTH domain
MLKRGDQTKIATDLGVTRVWINKVLRKQDRPSIKFALRLERYMTKHFPDENFKASDLRPELIKDV